MTMNTNPARHRRSPGLNPPTSRRGAASLELVMATAVMLPLTVLLLLLGIKICSYVFSALGGLTLMPFL